MCPDSQLITATSICKADFLQAGLFAYKGVRLAQVINSVLMANVRVADGAHVQASILCDGVRVAEHAILRDCQVCMLRSAPSGLSAQGCGP